jgi:hypothetical protein
MMEEIKTKPCRSIKVTYVSKCGECPYVSAYSSGCGEYCEHVHGNADQEIYIDDMPEWCPLESVIIVDKSLTEQFRVNCSCCARRRNCPGQTSNENDALEKQLAHKDAIIIAQSKLSDLYRALFLHSDKCIRMAAFNVPITQIEDDEFRNLIKRKDAACEYLESLKS